MSDAFDFILTDKVSPNNRAGVFDFREQMAVGDRGERDFVLKYPSLHPKKSKDLAYDFDLNTGVTVELKTDDYAMEASPNFFMETVSDLKTGKPGGPIRAFEDEVTFFVYYYIRNQTWFWFDTDKLYKRLNEIINSNCYKIKLIKNKGWASHGYAIPRAEFEDIIWRKDISLDPV